MPWLPTAVSTTSSWAPIKQLEATVILDQDVAALYHCYKAQESFICPRVILYAQANPLMCWTHGPQIQIPQVTHLPSLSASDCVNTSTPYYNKSGYWSRKSDGNHTLYISFRLHQHKMCIPDAPDKHLSKPLLHLAPLLLWQHAVTQFLWVRSVLYIDASPACQDLSSSRLLLRGGSIDHMTFFPNAPTAAPSHRQNFLVSALSCNMCRRADAQPPPGFVFFDTLEWSWSNGSGNAWKYSSMLWMSSTCPTYSLCQFWDLWLKSTQNSEEHVISRLVNYLDSGFKKCL